MTSSPDRPLSAEQPARASRPSRRLGLGLALWIAGGLAAGVGLYAAGGFWLAPRIIKSVVVKQVAERYHRAASLGEVRFNPFTEALYRKQFGAKPDIPKPQVEDGAKPDKDKAAIAWLEEKLRARIAVTDEELQQLGRERAQAVQSVLLSDAQIAPSRVFVTAKPPLAAKAAPVRMELSLS